MSRVRLRRQEIILDPQHEEPHLRLSMPRMYESRPTRHLQSTEPHQPRDRTRRYLLVNSTRVARPPTSSIQHFLVISVSRRQIHIQIVTDYDSHVEYVQYDVERCILCPE